MNGAGLVITVVAISLLLGFGAGTAALAVEPQKQRAPAARPDAKAMVQEFNALERRLQILTPGRKSSDPRVAAQAEADRANLIRDLDNWAKKYSVRVESKTQTEKGVAPKEGVAYKPANCPCRDVKTEDMGRGPGERKSAICVVTKCYYDRRAEFWVCEYRCYISFPSILD